LGVFFPIRMAQQSHHSAGYAHFGASMHKLTPPPPPPTVPSAFFTQTVGDRPRPHYCYVHGFNIRHFNINNSA
jgi:hypothetical protein